MEMIDTNPKTIDDLHEDEHQQKSGDGLEQTALDVMMNTGSKIVAGVDHCIALTTSVVSTVAKHNNLLN
jgi:hypothetical protein